MSSSHLPNCKNRASVGPLRNVISVNRIPPADDQDDFHLSCIRRLMCANHVARRGPTPEVTDRLAQGHVEARIGIQFFKGTGNCAPDSYLSGLSKPSLTSSHFPNDIRQPAKRMPNLLINGSWPSGSED